MLFIPFLKCLFSRTNLIQCQRQPGRDWEAVLAVQLQPSALSDAKNWRVSEIGFNRRPICCRPQPQKKVGAIPALCGGQPTQLLLSWCEWKLILLGSCVCAVVTVKQIYSDSLFTVSVHPSRVFGALFQSADRCFSSLCLCWLSDWGGCLPLTALY